MYRHSLQQRWFQRRQLFSKHVPADIQAWLFDPASLTARLKQKCTAGFRVEVLSQTIQKPRLDEFRTLGMNTGNYALIRQVRLCCGSACWVYARTVIPFSTIKGKQRIYANLGSRPLGAMLFADRTMRRDEVMVTSLPGSQLPSGLGLAQDDIVWGRRSIFRIAAKPLLVSEYFLPALLEDSK
jgi:chorismate--pyruvate lyase